GASQFSKHQLSTSWYTPLSPRFLIATRVRGGFIDPYGPSHIVSGTDSTTDRDLVPFIDRFKTGGVNTLRGYNEGQLPFDGQGGLVLVGANAELRYDAWGPLGLEVYVDAGTVWSDARDVKHARLGPDFG